MEIPRQVAAPLSVVDQLRIRHSQSTPAADEVKAPPRQKLMDRRLRPDRRQRQLPYEGADRRRRSCRRRPLLLDPRTGRGTALEDSRGRLVSTRV